MPHRHRRAGTATASPARLLGALACALALPAQAQSSGVSVEDLARRLQAIEQRLGTAPTDAGTAAVDPADLDQRLRVIERKLELQAEAESARVASTPVVTLSAAKGLSVKSAPPGDLEIKFRGLIQADGRFFIDDQRVPQNDTFLFRRVEPTIEGTWGSLFAFRLGAQLAGDSATVNDAYVDVRFSPRATVRVGRYKVPLGLERLQSSSAGAMVEGGFASELAPVRDLGVQLQGEFADGAVSYAVGAFNGAPDGRDGATTNPDNEFELIGRVFVEPWKNSGGVLSGLGFGVGASQGDKRGTGNNFLPRYRTPGQAQFFNYRSTVVADGEHTRWSPQAYYYRNRLGLLGEYIRSRQELLLPASGARAALDHDAWQLTAGWVLTGEDASYKGVVKPSQPFTPGGDGWGAFELVARYGRLDIDDDAFPRYADPGAVASEASSWGLGLNWYLTSNFKLVANYTQTDFEGGAPAGADREDEKAFFTRAQFSF
ncbi:OprO/OprP family phosphate-selective porin [Lysobacter sp. cf310]|uniref:OprO/OprP family phosphate-selective porin n=1 Tax=Lysobacter sp. cf310 TaxID=1761790 RepID=UPI0008E8BCD7|nr:porin [Lysobacter sp. cf310]SFL05545.1 phosphate-selective porin OprO and OprP [Lysobacter sp. cf310]